MKHLKIFIKQAFIYKISKSEKNIILSLYRILILIFK